MNGHGTCVLIIRDDCGHQRGMTIMVLLKWAALLAVFAIIAAILGFGGLASGLAGVAKFLFFVFLIGVIILVALGIFLFNKLA